MIQLKELYIHDTKISLVNLSHVFRECRNISTLSFTIKEETLDPSDLPGMDWDYLIQGLHKLVSLKLQAVNTAYYIDSWLTTLNLLRLLDKLL
jgi:hypothetical protein